VTDERYEAGPGDAVVVEIYGGSRFVIAVENIVEISTVPNGDYGKRAPKYIVPEGVLAEALGIELPGAGDGDSDRSRRLEVQLAGGTLVTGGVTFPFRDGSFELTLLGGIGHAAGHKVALAQRLAWTMPERRVAPRVSVYAVEVTDLSDIGIAAGPSIGATFKLRRFASAVIFDNAFVANVRPYEPEYMVYMPSIGVQF
jgi:hypothetical protein